MYIQQHIYISPYHGLPQSVSFSRRSPVLKSCVNGKRINTYIYTQVFIHKYTTNIYIYISYHSMGSLSLCRIPALPRIETCCERKTEKYIHIYTNIYTQIYNKHIYLYILPQHGLPQSVSLSRRSPVLKRGVNGKRFDAGPPRELRDEVRVAACEFTDGQHATHNAVRAHKQTRVRKRCTGATHARLVVANRWCKKKRNTRERGGSG